MNLAKQCCGSGSIFFGFPDPDPFVVGMGPDLAPDPFNNQK
jgi:hypothetical protein